MTEYRVKLAQNSLRDFARSTAGPISTPPKGATFGGEKLRVVLLTALLTIAGCSHMPHPHWPFHRKPAPPPEVVHELVITSPEGADMSFPQYWKGNTLIVDLRLAGARGNAVLKPRAHTVWPVRLAFRVSPGQFGVLEAHAKQRAVLPITTSGTKPVDMELDAGVYIMKSPQIDLSWGPAEQSPAPGT